MCKSPTCERYVTRSVGTSDICKHTALHRGSKTERRFVEGLSRTGTARGGRRKVLHRRTRENYNFMECYKWLQKQFQPDEDRDTKVSFEYGIPENH